LTRRDRGVDNPLGVAGPEAAAFGMGWTIRSPREGHMHRIKIGLVAAGILVVATILFYAKVTSTLRAAASADIEEKVARAQRVYQHLSRLGGMDFANLATEKARRPSLVAVSERGEETARRQAAFEECEAIKAALLHASHKVDLVAYLDSTGKVIARDLNANAMFGEDLRARFPAVGQALKGKSVKDVWTLDRRMQQVALAPVTKPDGTIVGALLIGYVLSARAAQDNRNLLGTDIAYFHNGKVHTSSFVAADSSFGGPEKGGKEDVARTQALDAYLFQSGDKLAEQALTKNAPTEFGRFETEGEVYVVVAAPLPGNFADRTSGVALLASTRDGLDRAGDSGAAMIIFALLAIVVALGAAVMTAKRFIAPLDSVEVGVGEIINGNIDFTFKPVGPDFEGLSNSLNVMLARLLGREEPNEDAVDEEDEAPKWKAEQMLIAESPDPAAAAAAAALGQESEASYYPRLFNEYVGASRGLGKPVDGMSVLSFMAKLHLAEAGLEQKWSCKLVRFVIAIRGGDVVFQPVKVA
jgi:hypothetical protein